MARFALGAKAADALHFVGMGSMDELSRICQTGAKCVKIIKPHENDDEIFARIAHAEACGCVAVGMDIDHAFSGAGAYDVVLGERMRPKSARQLAAYARATKLPFIIKGVLSVTDAKKCLDIGARGIIVSHHHGILPCAVPPLYVLPDIARAVGGDMTVLVDCGIESGMDAFKALALGANAVCVGRALMTPLRDAGEDGVRDKIRQMTAELRGAMARTGARTLDSIDPSVLHARHF